MPASKAHQRATNKFISKAYDRVNLTLPKGQKDVVQGHAAARGESVNGFIGRAISETMERDGGGTCPVVSTDQQTVAGPQGAGNYQQGSGGIFLPSDVLEAVQRAAGEAVPDYAARVIREAVETGTGGNASVSPVQAQGGPYGAGMVSLPLETEKAAQKAAEATGEDMADFIARAVDTQAQRDKVSLHMGVNPATGQKVQSGE